jgi:hypothetical protein
MINRGVPPAEVQQAAIGAEMTADEQTERSRSLSRPDITDRQPD